MSGITETLARYATSLTYEQLPAEVIEKAKQHVLDLLGIALRAAVDADSTPSVRAAVRDLAAPGDVPVWGEEFTLGPAHAALLNATYGHSLDFDDTHREGSVHPGASVIPAALALAEQYQVDGRRLITATVAGYDVTCKLAMALDPKSHYDRGFHPTATAGVFGATAAGASLLGLSASQLEHAFGINGSQAAGSMQFFDNGAWNKRIHPGLAAHNAIIALQLAHHGFVGASRAIEGRYGLLRGYSDRAHPELAASALGERFEILYTAIKPYPACRYAHGPLDAIIDLVNAPDIRPEEIESVTIGLCDAGVDLIGQPVERKRDPQNIVDGQFSMHFLAAAAIIRRRMTWNDYDLLRDPGVRDLMQRITVVPNAEANRVFPRQWLASVQIRARGRTFADRRCQARGEPESPLTWPEIVAKFESLASAVLSPDRRRQLANAVQTLERASDVRAIGLLLRRQAVLRVG